MAVAALDEISGGRFTLGVGAGGTRSDAGVLGAVEWSPGERADRFAEWVELADLLLRRDETTFTGRFYAAGRAVVGGGDPHGVSVVGSRLPLAIAASGPRGLRLAARHADIWVTLGDPRHRAGAATAAVARQMGRLDEECRATGRTPTLRRMLLTGTTDERPLASVEAFRDYSGHYADLGITDLALHRPTTSLPRWPCWNRWPPA